MPLSFFTEFQKVRLTVPRLGLLSMWNENSEYVNQCGWSKNSYLCFASLYLEDCYYNRMLTRSKSMTDCSYCNFCEYLYECIDCDYCTNSIYLQNCKMIHDSNFCYNCRDSRNLFLCTNLRHKNYCILNKQYTKDQYENEIKRLRQELNTEKLLETFEELKNKTIRISICQDYAENCKGDHIINSKNCYWLFDSGGSMDSGYLFDSFTCHNSYDCSFAGDYGCEIQLCYEIQSTAGNLFNCNFCSWGMNMVDCEYCEMCQDCNNCFGCTHLRHKKYCILNEQYTKDEYEKRVKELKEKMRQNGEYGQWFESVYPYKDTLAAAE